MRDTREGTRPHPTLSVFSEARLLFVLDPGACQVICLRMPYRGSHAVRGP